MEFHGTKFRYFVVFVHFWFTSQVAHESVPKTIIHGDYKISNLFVDNDKSKVVTIDWQWIGIGNPATDLAYLTSTSLDIAKVFDGSYEERTRKQEKYGYYDAKEMELLHVYHKALLAKGIEDYDFETFEQQYLLNVIYFFIFAVRAKYAKVPLPLCYLFHSLFFLNVFYCR